MGGRGKGRKGLPGGYPCHSLVRFFEDFAEPRIGLQVRSRQSAEPRTRLSVQVQDGPVLVWEGFEPRTELFLHENLFIAI